MIKNEIWILADDRPGTFSQSIGLAQELGYDYKKINLSYNIFAKLPNIILNGSALSLKAPKSLKNPEYFPKIIISAGRRSANIALYLKEKSQNQSKIIQIMHPNLNLNKFDFVILPKHDNIHKTSNNIITTIGALTKTNADDIKKSQEHFKELAQFKKPIITVLVGGSSKKTEFNSQSAVKLVNIIDKIANNMAASLVILNSRRTSNEITNIIKTNLTCNFTFFDYKEIVDNNPYLALLGYSDYFIVTGDSISMISECASTGKSLYIFDEKNISTAKHRAFHKSLFEEDYAKKLQETDFLEANPPKKLQETSRIAQIIKDKISL